MKKIIYSIFSLLFLFTSCVNIKQLDGRFFRQLKFPIVSIGSEYIAFKKDSMVYSYNKNSFQFDKTSVGTYKVLSKYKLVLNESIDIFNLPLNIISKDDFKESIRFYPIVTANKFYKDTSIFRYSIILDNKEDYYFDPNNKDTFNFTGFKYLVIRIVRLKSVNQSVNSNNEVVGVSLEDINDTMYTQKIIFNEDNNFYIATLNMPNEFFRIKKIDNPVIIFKNKRKLLFDGHIFEKRVL